MRLSHKVFLVAAAALLAVIGVILGAVIPRWRDELERGERQRGRVMIQMLARSWAEPAMVGNYSELQRAVDSVASRDDVLFAAVIDRRGRTVVSSRRRSGKRFFAIDRAPPDPSGLLAGGTSTTRVAKVRRGSVPYLDFVAPLTVYRRSWGLARLGISLEPSSRAARAVTWRLLWISAAGLALGALLSALLAVGITRPLASLAAAARRLSARQLDMRVELRGGRELLDLGRAFNQMATAIESHVAQVEEKRRELEAGYRVLSRLTTTVDRLALIEGVLQVIADVVGAARCELMAFDPRRGEVDHFCYDAQTGRCEHRVDAIDGGPNDDAPPAEAIAARLAAGPPDIYVPLEAEGIQLGGMRLRAGAGGVFSDFHRRLASGISHHLLVALENARLYELAIYDTLTRLTVRRYFLARLDEQLALARRYEQSFSLLMIDVDHFKRINDTRGHPAGDRVLAGIAARLSAELRSSDLVSRYGGEEMIALLPNQGPTAAASVAEKLRAAVAGELFSDPSGDKLAATISIGVASYPGHGLAATDLIEAADRAMYAAKQAGRNRVQLAGEPPA